MTGGYGLLVPLMLTSAIAVILVPKRVSIYEEQVDGSLNSPAHFDRYLRHVAEKLRASPSPGFRLVDEQGGRERVTTGSAAIDLSALGSAVLLELEMKHGLPLIGATIRDLDLGPGVLPIAIQRDGATLVATPAHRLAAGDHLVVIAESERAEAVLARFRGDAGAA
jgi:hypothetical protein